MKSFVRLALVAAILATMVAPAMARRSKGHPKKPTAPKPNVAQIEAVTRLQIFLDRANFSPGVINGQYDDFTVKALALYRQSRGEQPAAPPPKPGMPPDLSGIDLNSLGQTFTDYTVVDADLQNIGPVPNGERAQAKLKFLPYRNAAEAIAEKFHCDARFLEQLNPGKTKIIKAGDQLKVPNVEPFDLASVKQLKPGSEIEQNAANDLPDESSTETSQPSPAASNPSATPASAVVSIKIDTHTNMLSVFESDKLIAAYPVTIGSAQTASPIGEWKVRGITKLPKFRYDKEMLQHGKRSGNFYMLPSGPNSPVGVIWIALNKKGIGLHGTSEPETIGHAVSHGCVRLTNWDVVRLAQKVTVGVPVSIH